MQRFHEQEGDPLQLPAAFGAHDSSQFADWVDGRSTPRLFVQTMAIIAYKIRPPSRDYLYGPALAAFAFVIPIATYLVLKLL